MGVTDIIAWPLQDTDVLKQRAAHISSTLYLQGNAKAACKVLNLRRLAVRKSD